MVFIISKSNQKVSKKNQKHIQHVYNFKIQKSPLLK